MRTQKPERKPQPRHGEGPAGLSRRCVALTVCAILVVSLAVRMVHLAAILGSRSPQLPVVYQQSDMRALLDWSDAILAGDLLQRDTFHPYFDWMRQMAPLETWYRWWGGQTIFHWEPLYVYALSLVRWMSGRSLWTPPFVQLLIGSLQPLPIFLLARRLSSERAALLAAALTAIYGPFIFCQGFVLRDWLPPLMEPVALLLLLRADRQGGMANSLAAGLWLAACTLTKSLILLFLPFALLWLAWRRRMNKGYWWRRPALLLAGFVVGLSPLMIRNVAVGAPVLSMHNRIVENVIQGNAVDARPVGLAYPPSMQAILSKADGRLTAVVAEVLRGYQGRWLDFLRLQLLKLRGVFEPIEIPNNVGFYHGRELSPVLWLAIGFGPVAVAGLAGLLGTIWHRGPQRLLLIYVVTQVGSLMSSTLVGRHRLALAAVLLIYAGSALVSLWEAIRQRRAKTASLCLGLLLATTTLEYVLVPIPHLRTEPGFEYYEPDYVVSATLAVSEQRYQDALDESRRVRAWTPRFPQADVLARVLERDTRHIWARTLLEQSDKAEALTQARLAARIDVPVVGLDDIHFHLGDLFRQLGSPAEAAAQLQLYLQKQPDGPLAAQARNLLDQLGQR